MGRVKSGGDDQAIHRGGTRMIGKSKQDLEKEWEE